MPAAKKTWKHGMPEYNAFTALTKATDPNQRIQLAQQFLRQYPDSDYKIEGLQIELAGEAASNPAQAVQTADQLTRTPGVTAQALANAYAVIAYNMPELIQPNDPQLEAKLNQLNMASQCGPQILNQLAQSTQMNPQQQQQFEAQRQQTQAIFDRAAGFAALQRKDYPTAKTDLARAAQANPKDALVFYWLGISQLSDKPPDFNNGIFSLARAATLAPQATTFSNYLNQVYTSYHGSAEGLQQGCPQVPPAAAGCISVMQAAQNPTPPPDFKVASQADIQNAQLQAQQASQPAAPAELPPADSFPGMKARLMKPDMADNEWRQIKNTDLVGLQGVVVSSTLRTVNIAVGQTDAANATPDLRVLLATPHRVPTGTQVTIEGIASEYKTSPDFLLILTKGVVHPKTAARTSTSTTRRRRRTTQ
jgi:tetratricopeptide (TPR) repeat protein